MHDWLRECYPDFPKVCDKTVFNFVEKVRCKYGIGKKSEARIRRDYEKLPDTPYGKYAQADLGEKWMSAENGRSSTSSAKVSVSRMQAKFGSISLFFSLSSLFATITTGQPVCTK